MAIQKLKTGKYLANFYVNGKQIKRQFDKKKDAASYIERRKKTEPDQHRSFMEQNFSSLPFSALVEEYRPHLAESKANSNMWYINAICDKWGEYTIANITGKEFRAWIRHLFSLEKEPGVKNYAVATVEKFYSYTNTIFNHAMKEEVISINPIAHVSFEREFRMKNVRNTVIQPEQFEKMKKLFENERWYIKGILLVLWGTGMRIGEVLMMKWSEVFLSEAVIVFEADRVKEKAVRTIALDKDLVKLLQGLKKKNDKKGTKSKTYVFGVTKDNPLSYQTWYNTFRKVVKNTEFENFTTHDTRHCFVTIKDKEGYQQSVIMKQTGHKTDSMFRRYNFTDKKDVQEMMGFNDNKKELIEDKVKDIVEVMKQNNIPLGTLHSTIKNQL